jgi:hypothetical protein
MSTTDIDYTLPDHTIFVEAVQYEKFIPFICINFL